MKRWGLRHKGFRIGFIGVGVCSVFFVIGFTAPAWRNSMGLWMDCTESFRMCVSHSYRGEHDPLTKLPAWFDAVRGLECLGLAAIIMCVMAEIYMDFLSQPAPDRRLVEVLALAAGGMGLLGCIIFAAFTPLTGRNSVPILNWGFGLSTTSSCLLVAFSSVMAYFRHKGLDVSSYAASNAVRFRVSDGAVLSASGAPTAGFSGVDLAPPPYSEVVFSSSSPPGGQFPEGGSSSGGIQGGGGGGGGLHRLDYGGGYKGPENVPPPPAYYPPPPGGQFEAPPPYVQTPPPVSGVVVNSCSASIIPGGGGGGGGGPGVEETRSSSSSSSSSSATVSSPPPHHHHHHHPEAVSPETGWTNPGVNLVDFGTDVFTGQQGGEDHTTGTPSSVEPGRLCPASSGEAAVSCGMESVPAYYVTMFGQRVPVFLEELLQAGQEMPPSASAPVPSYFIVTNGQHVPVYSEEQARALHS